jgi:PAS domain S-box-containing protein
VREGKSAGVRGIAVDITQRKRAEMELRAAKERLDYVVTSNPAVIFSAKPRADYSDYNIAYMSDRVVEMLGFEPRQFIGHPEFWDGHVHPDDLRRYPMEVPELWKKGQCTFEYRFLHKDGSYRWIREEANVIRDAADKPVEVMGYWTDVTERKRMEAELADARRLAVIGETAAMVGHDLRNPLQAIVSTVYLAKRELESQIEPSKKPAVKPGLVAMLETIENESQYMNKIVSDLQDYATPLKTEPKPVQMESLVRDTLLKIRIPQNVKVSFKVSETLQTVTVDPAVMRRVFSNLIMNTIQAMPNGGELTIDLSRTEEHLLVSFRDRGVGIPEENLGKLFNPFFTTKSKGQGLGLPVCKKLVEAQNGRITVESKPGEGSTFTVKLPLVKP